MSNNAVYYTIIAYIILIIILFMSKPEFMYDHKNNKFKEFGFEDDAKTIFSLHVVSIVSAILLYIIIINFCDNNKEKQNQNMMTGGYVYYPMMNQQNNIPMNQMGFFMPQNLIKQNQ